MSTIGNMVDDRNDLEFWVERWASMTTLDEQSGCWIWQGATHPRGYGIVTPTKSETGTQRIHRFKRRRINRTKTMLPIGTGATGTVVPEAMSTPRKTPTTMALTNGGVSVRRVERTAD